MNSDANPFHIIFLCYSKILPVVLGETTMQFCGWMGLGAYAGKDDVPVIESFCQNV